MVNSFRRLAYAAGIIFLVFVSTANGAKYAGEFLNLGAGGKPLALGGSFMAAHNSVLSGYYNPAGLSMLKGSQAVFMHSESFGSLLNHDFLSYSRPLDSGVRKAALGISLYRLGGGGVIVTGVDQNNHFVKISEESHADYAAYFSYGRAFSEKLSGGISAKLIYRDIVDVSAFGIGIDMGGLYSPKKWLSLGISLQDITTTLLSYSTGKKESIIPAVRLGASLNARKGGFGSAMYMDAETRFEGRRYASQYNIDGMSIDSHLGLEIDYREAIFGRIGSDVGNLTLGVGLVVKKFVIDIAMRDHSELDNTYLVSITFQL
ncbi:MAG: PorV/PorQ family protein [Candidatus Zixiibacteriota bacterium]|nr:MAG: PorV/PorQ family protein [candidate division Zixibacteria bacterium]